MAISITDDIKPIKELEDDAMQVMRQMHDTGRPIVLTVNGKADAVLMDAREYERIMQALAMMKLLLIAEDDVKAGRVSDASAFFEEFRRDKGLSR